MFWQNSLGNKLISDTYEVPPFNLVITSLTIINIQATYGGIYTCISVNEAGNDTSSVVVYIQPYFIFQTEDILTRNGSINNLTCMAEAFPPPVLQWEMLIDDDSSGGLSGSGDLLSSEEVWTVKAYGEALEFFPVMFGDEGLYRCIATSNTGKMTLSSSNTVTGECVVTYESTLQLNKLQ